MTHADYNAHDEHSCCATQPSTSAVTDPVCGMTVDPATTAHHAAHDGEDYHFCSAGCRTKFVADPDKYLSDVPRPEPKALPGAIWTCPMHPEVRQEGPGTCPFCGMALEPEEPSLDDAPNPELVNFTRRFWVSAALAVVEPQSSGLGGGGFWLLHDAANDRDVMVDGREKAPGAATRSKVGLGM